MGTKLEKNNDFNSMSKNEAIKVIIKGKNSHMWTVFFVLTFMLFSMSNVSAGSPKNIKNTNINDQAFTVSWVTDAEEVGEIRYGTDPDNITIIAYDDRGASVSDDTHHVTIGGLVSETVYYYDIVSGEVTYDNGGSHYSVSTGPTLALPASDTIYGKVYKSDGSTPAEGAIVYVTVTDNNGAGSSGNSQVLSGLVDSDGWWNVNIGPIRTGDLSSYYAYSASGDSVVIDAQGAVDGGASQTVDTDSDTPAPTLINEVNCFTEEINENWNLLSTNIAFSVTEKFSDGSSFASVWKWANNNWAVYLPGEETAGEYATSKGFAVLTTINPGEGFWVNCLSGQTITLSGIAETGGLSLTQGWNLVGLKASQGTTIDALISGKEANIISIWKWVDNAWAVYLPGEADGGASYADSKGFTLLEEINPGEGFWVNASTSVTLD